MKTRKQKRGSKAKRLYPFIKKTDALYWRVPGSFGRKG